MAMSADLRSQVARLRDEMEDADNEAPAGYPRWLRPGYWAGRLTKLLTEDALLSAPASSGWQPEAMKSLAAIVGQVFFVNEGVGLGTLGGEYMRCRVCRQGSKKGGTFADFPQHRVGCIVETFAAAIREAWTAPPVSAPPREE